MSDSPPRILYCRCAFAQVVPEATKNEVLEGLCDSGADFESVADLCEMAARRDKRLGQIAGDGPLRIAACHPRAVKWLFHQAGAPLPEGEDTGARVLNMRDDPPGEIVEQLLQP